MENKILDPLDNLKAIQSRQLRLNSGYGNPVNQYLPIKAAYLVLRHGLTPDNHLARYWADGVGISEISSKAILLLANELAAVKLNPENVTTLSDKYPGFERYASLLLGRRKTTFRE
jgi:hypothetical protein